ncbi:MAG TPA: hypothetical protein VMM38_09715 [Aridibacter sp.]|nr:hypothetical protein [Aridibacter sp.]
MKNSIKGAFLALSSVLILTSATLGQPETDETKAFLDACAQELFPAGTGKEVPTNFGAVLSKTGKPVPSANVIPEDEFGMNSRAKASSGGCFEIERIEPGAIYHLEVRYKSGSSKVSGRSFECGDRLALKAVN